MTLAYDTIVDLLNADVKLAFPDTGPDAQPLELYCDASSMCLGASLMQRQGEHLRVITHSSRKLSGPETRWAIIDKELLSITEGIKQHSHFLKGKTFKVLSDHKPLTFLLTAKTVSNRLARTLEQVQEYDFEIIYIKGDENKTADYLSRWAVTPNEFIPDLDDIETSTYNVANDYNVKLIPGGDNNLIQAASTAYNFISGIEVPLMSLDELRTTLAKEIEDHKSRYFNLPIQPQFLKHIRTMYTPGVTPSLEFLQAFANMYKVKVAV